MSWWRRKRWARLRRGTRLSPNCDASTLLTVPTLVHVTAKAPWIGGVRFGYARSMRTSLGPSRRPERVRRECSHRNILQCRTMRMPIRPCPIRNECPPSGLPSFYSPTHCCYCKYALNPSDEYHTPRSFLYASSACLFLSSCCLIMPWNFFCCSSNRILALFRIAYCSRDGVGWRV